MLFDRFLIGLVEKKTLEAVNFNVFLYINYTSGRVFDQEGRNSSKTLGGSVDTRLKNCENREAAVAGGNSSISIYFLLFVPVEAL